MVSSTRCGNRDPQQPHDLFQVLPGLRLLTRAAKQIRGVKRGHQLRRRQPQMMQPRWGEIVKLTPQSADRGLRLQQRLGRRSTQCHDHVRSQDCQLSAQIGPTRIGLLIGGCGCRAGGTSRCCKYRPDRELASSLRSCTSATVRPVRRTDDLADPPLLPGPRRQMRLAAAQPSPKTTCLRPACNPHLVHPWTYPSSNCRNA